MGDDELVAVFDAESEVSAILYAEMLGEAGIEVVERLWEGDMLAGVRMRGMHSQLLVLAEDEEKARELVQAFSAAEPEVTE